MKRIWREKCDQQLAHEKAIDSKDLEIATLKTRLLSQTTSPLHEEHNSPDGSMLTSTPAPSYHRGKAPPVDQFSAENEDERWDDWLPSFERAAEWNGWTNAKRLLQLAGHLRGKARQEFLLLSEKEKISFKNAVTAMRCRLETGSRTLAAQDFRHATQGFHEPASDYILRLEKIFRRAYGRDHMTDETQQTLLYGQLQEGLRYTLMKSPAVSGARNYQELCVAARNEERRLNDLNKRQQYMRNSTVDGSQDRQLPRQYRPTTSTRSSPIDGSPSVNRTRPLPSNHSLPPRRCYICNDTGHIAKDCNKTGKSESTGKANQVQVTTEACVNTDCMSPVSKLQVSPLDLLLSDSEDEDVIREVRITDKGSESRCVDVQVQGVPAVGIVDTAADITIMGGSLFKKVASVARLRKRDFKSADKVPHGYDQRPFQLNGRMDLDITFGDKTMKTAVYIKMDAVDQLLLSEGVCRQLDIISYHGNVKKCRGAKQGATHHIKVVKTVYVLPHQSVMAQVHVPGNCPLLVEDSCHLHEAAGLLLEDTLVKPNADGLAYVVLSNPMGCSGHVTAGTTVGIAAEVQVVDKGITEVPILDKSTRSPLVEDASAVCSVTSEMDRKGRLLELIEKPSLLNDQQTQELLGFLTSHHTAFSLDDLDRGETNLLDMEIHTGNESPRRVLMRRMPLAVRQEVARQLQKMQDTGVIEPSSNPWSSPVVMVRKKDGTLRFCVDYRELNKVTKKDTYPLPHVDDLLDEIGDARYFSTLDLASGYWQIRVAASSREKTAFITPEGLFQFRVMPFGLTNAPAVFQRLMQSVLMGLNPVGGKHFVFVYMDDVLVFSETLKDHLKHLQLVIQRIQDAGLKLKPSKCHFVREEIQFLGHVL